MAAEPERLAKGEPALSRETVLDDGPPQDQHLIPEYPRCVAALRGMASDALIAVAHGDPAGLQLGDDLVGDLRVKARAVVAELMWCVWTSRFSATGPEASPPAFSPSRQTRSAPSLSATVTPPALWQTGFAGRAAVFASGMEAQRVKTREAGLQSSRQPDPAGRRRRATARSSGVQQLPRR